MSGTLSELKLSRTTVTGDITTFAEFKQLSILELARLPKVYIQYIYTPGLNVYIYYALMTS